jgi:hypothetical protein
VAEDLGGRLLAATLVTPEQLADAAGRRLPLAPALVDGGLDEGVLESFLRGEGFEVTAELRSDPAALAQVPGAVAQRLWALPLRVEEEGLVVAMADPSDGHVTRELALVSGTLLVPRLARVSALRAALDQAYPDDIVPDVRDSEPDITFELTRPRTPPAGLSRDSEPPSDDVVLLVRPKGDRAAVAPLNLVPKASADAGPAPEPTTQKRFSRPAGVQAPRISTLPSPLTATDAADGGADTDADTFANARVSAVDAADAWGVGSGRARAGASIEIDLSDSWDDLDAPVSVESQPAPAGASAPNAVRGGRKSYNRLPVRAPGDIGTTLAQMRTLRDRDAVLTMACEATLLVARAAVFLALRGQVLRGWSGRGGSLTPDAVRNLWIPISTPSMFRGVVQDGALYTGPYGVTAADNLFRAATGSRGGVVVVCPVEVMGKTVAVLVADDVRYGDDGAERVETLAQAVGDALKRIILARKG